MIRDTVVVPRVAKPRVGMTLRFILMGERSNLGDQPEKLLFNRKTVLSLTNHLVSS